MSVLCKRKIKLLYDGTILAEGAGRGSNRSGIFMVVYHLFCELLKHPEFKVVLYSNPGQLAAVKEFIRTDPFIRNYYVPIINDPDDVDPTIWGLESLNQSIVSVRMKKNRLCFEHKCFRCQALRGVLLGQKVIRWILRKIGGVSGRSQDSWGTIQAAFAPALPHPQEVMDRKTIKRYYFLHDAIPYIFPDLFPDTREGCSWNLNLLGLLGAEDVCFSNSEQTRKDFLYFSRLFRDCHSDFLEMFTSRKNCNEYTSHVVEAFQGRKQRNESTGLVGPGTVLKPENIEVTLLAASERFYHTIDVQRRHDVLSKYHIPTNGHYIFTLCTLEKRKNIVYAIRNFLRFVEKNGLKDLYLVLGGGSWSMYTSELNAILNGSRASDQIFKIGYVDDADIPVLFSNALCTIYPSIYEGFGLPVLEAMQCGCPVIASNSSSIPEVLGDAGILIDVSQDQPLLDALDRLYRDPELRKTYTQRGLERAKLFSWKKAGDIIANRIRKDFNLKERK